MLHAGETLVEALVLVGEAVVPVAEEVEHGGVKVADVERVFDDVVAEVVGLAMRVALAETAAGGEVKGDILAPSNPARLFTRNKMRGLP